MSEDESDLLNNATKIKVKEFLESKPLYVKLRIVLPENFSIVEPDVLLLMCPICRAERPFGQLKPRPGNSGDPLPYPSFGHYTYPPPRTLEIHEFKYRCTACKKEEFKCWLLANYEGNNWIQKVGQIPMWLPVIPKEIEAELGEDAELYKKALRNMNEGYGIGACAYLRRLIEQYINPLLQLLYDIKQSEGESPEKLAAITEAIKAKDFTAKTKFASEIAPQSILMPGHNPLKEIHERLSIGLHTLDEETALQYAIVIKGALEFIIRRLRRELNERREYAAQLKAIRNLPTS